MRDANTAMPLTPAIIPPKLSVELVPKTCWFSNVRDHVDAATWDRLRREVSQEAGERCALCGGRGPRWPVECHEVWHYDDAAHRQTLAGLAALCPACHEVKHIGLAEMRGVGRRARAHLARVNGWGQDETEAYLEGVWEVWFVRSRFEWSVDFSWLAGRGVHVTPKR